MMRKGKHELTKKEIRELQRKAGTPLLNFSISSMIMKTRMHLNDTEDDFRIEMNTLYEKMIAMK